MNRCRLVVMGCPWRGLSALRGILQPLPKTFRVPVVAAQHRSPRSVDGSMAAALEAHISLPIREVDEKVRFSRPSIDVLFESAADAYGAGLVAVLLTGANHDGTAGLLMVKDRGGMTIVQDPATAERAEMPQTAIDAGAADAVVPVEQISDLLLEVVGQPAGERA